MKKSDVEQQLEYMDQDEMLDILEEVLAHPDYERDDYTQMMHDLLEKGREMKLKYVQIKAIKTHLNFQSKVWY